MNLKTVTLFGFFFAAAAGFAAEEETLFHTQVRAAMPQVASFHQKGSAAWEMKDQSGAKLGMLYLETIPDAERKKGYGGTIEVALTVNEKNEITSVLIGNNKETPRFLKRVHAEGFLKKWNGMTLKKAAETDVDFVSGATYSSSAIASGVRKLASSLIEGGNEQSK